MVDQQIGGSDMEYEELEEIDFSIIGSRLRCLPFFDDDVFLGMQAMNVGLVDPIITDYEYDLLKELIRIEKTPTILALTVSALSQMWIYSLYEVLRMWRQRMYDFDKWYKNSGIEQKLSTMEEEDLNLTLNSRKRQMERYNSDSEYRDYIAYTWTHIEPIFRMTEMVRINLAKHCAPGKNNVIPRAPGYGRINFFCGALDYEVLLDGDFYTIINRRDIADELRECLKAYDYKGLSWGD